MTDKKTLLVIFASVALGTISALAYTMNEFVSSQDAHLRLQIRDGTEAVDPAVEEAMPKVKVLDGTTYDFGAMRVNAEETHTFVFQNTGDAPLMIKTKSTTCKCTVSQLKEDVVPPGQTRDVTLEWTPNGTSADFSQRAEIETNDPYHPVVALSIHGRVLRALSPVPPAISLQRLSASKNVTRRIVVFGYDESGFEITDYELLNENTASHFQVELSLTPTAEELAVDPYAKSATALQLTIHSGLPLGPLQQKIRLITTSLEMPHLEIPMEGTIVSDISIVGSGFSDARNLLRLGPVDAQKGIRKKLFVLVKGPHRDNIQLRLGTIDPEDVLQVELGDPQQVNDGLVHKYPLSITIPPGSRAVNRMGTKTSSYAEIHLQSEHPEAKDVPIYVGFTIQG